jgi:hypothetical protein
MYGLNVYNIILSVRSLYSEKIPSTSLTIHMIDKCHKERLLIRTIILLLCMVVNLGLGTIESVCEQRAQNNTQTYMARFSLCLTDRYAMKTYGGACINPRFLHLGTSMR